MKQVKMLLGVALAVCSCATASAVTSLEEMVFNIDLSGGTYDYFRPVGSPAIPGVDLSGFNTDTGLGTIHIAISGTGSHSVFSFFDHDIDLSGNGYINEVGSAHGAAAAGEAGRLTNRVSAMLWAIRAIFMTTWLPERWTTVSAQPIRTMFQWRWRGRSF